MTEWDADLERISLDDSVVSLLDDSESIAPSSSTGLGGCATQSNSEDNATQKSDDKRSACSSGICAFLETCMYIVTFSQFFPISLDIFSDTDKNFGVTKEGSYRPASASNFKFVAEVICTSSRGSTGSGGS